MRLGISHAHDRALSFTWAKSRKDVPGERHPLLFHMLDTAAVTSAMWDKTLHSSFRRWLTESASGIHDENAVGKVLAFWAGLHDIGKACPAFQAQDPCAKEKLESCGLRFPSAPPRIRHGLVTSATLREIIEANFRCPPSLAAQLAVILGGHHGVFPRSGDANLPKKAMGGSKWSELRVRLARMLACSLNVESIAFPDRLNHAAAMTLAGLVSVADWIASNEEFFPYASEDVRLDEYVSGTRAKAQKALNGGLCEKGLKWTGWEPPSDHRDIVDLFPKISEPRPLQEAVVKLTSNLERPGLVIIEAPMGEGKTEAAMYLADHWALTLGQRGCYFALPTQATSNQMFGRVKDFLAGRYAGEQVNLMLLHGHAQLSGEFEVLRRSGLYSPSGIDAGSGTEATVLAAEWFTHRKRGLLAPFGVGTVDQILLSVLQTRHVFVRLFGLAHKTVIIDEVHAYDTYMTTLIERLLEWLAALGCSVALLSATLPNKRRQQLANAYRRGLGEPGPALPAEKYPRVTWITSEDAGERHVEACGQATREMRIEWVNGRLPASGEAGFDLGKRLQAELAEGGCAAVICNTVNRAQQVYTALKPYFAEGELDLFHARYLFGDRQEREKRTLERFGKPEDSQLHRPRKAVLVATQVIEQSLDLDFDLMVTDMAPVDLILQRAGRLHRHEGRDRPEGLREPRLWICRPEEDSDGVPNFDAGTEAIYDGHVLLRSWLELRNRESIHVPDDVEDLIESVYDERTCSPKLPEPMKAAWEKSERKHSEEMESEKTEAQDRWIKSPLYSGALWRMTRDPREEDEPGFHQAHQALTRLAGTTARVVCLRRGGSGEEPCADAIDSGAVPDVTLARRLLMRSATISHRGVVRTLLDLDSPGGWRKNALLRHHRLLVFDEDNTARVGDYLLRLDLELGLCIDRADEEE